MLEYLKFFYSFVVITSKIIFSFFQTEIEKCQAKEVADDVENKDKCKSKSLVPSLLVSLPLPYPGIRPRNMTGTENRNLETGSVDSMHQELCYFKPIEGTTPTRYVVNKLDLVFFKLDIYIGTYICDLFNFILSTVAHMQYILLLLSIL